MSYTLLKGLRIIEISAFVAAPLAGLTLAQLGAEVIRIDPIGGGIDHSRWPLAKDGSSLYWSGLNRNKKSICLDLKSQDGQAALHALLQGHGSDGGILLTNLTGPDWLSFETLKTIREDLVMIDLKGHHDGAPAVDYTVNAAVGVPFATGPEETVGPVNNMLPAWDAAAGFSLATALLAALRARDRTGLAQHLSLALSDVAYAFMGNLGIMAETELMATSRPRIGNDLYGAFGTDLPTADGRYVMVVAITQRQWKQLANATGSAEKLDVLAAQHGLDFNTDGGRYEGRKIIAGVLRDWSSGLPFEDVCRALRAGSALWGPYQTFEQMMADDPRASPQNPMIQKIDHPSHGTYRVPGSTIRNQDEDEGPFQPPTVLGSHTEEILFDADLPRELAERLIQKANQKHG